MEQINIYAMTHKRFDEPDIGLYKPLFVGAANKQDTYGYLRDDSGDNISSKNCYYSELTGLYWIWKNVTDVDAVGTCHYRRYLVDEEDKLLSQDHILDDLKEYDCITTKALDLNFTYYEGFGENHKRYYLDETRKAIARVCPDYLQDYDKLVNDTHTYFGNIMIAKKGVYDSYASWLFTLLFDLEDNIVIEEEDSYHRRIFGFVSEFLWYLWVRHNNLKAKEYKVGIVGEKIEIKAVKARLRELFNGGRLQEAKEYFLEERQKRPDMMMEASDITGELHVCMEAIAIASLEQEMLNHNIINDLRDYDKIITYCNRLNAYVTEELYSKKESGVSDSSFATKSGEKMRHQSEQEESDEFSDIALEVAKRMWSK